jgi:intergrase/recombinase
VLRPGFEPGIVALRGQEEFRQPTFDSDFWSNYLKYLVNNVNPKTANDRITYGKKYYGILVSEEDSNMQQLLQFSEQKRVHVMKALATLSKYLGCYNQWKNLRENYQLKWSANNIDTFSHMMQTNIDAMMEWVKKAISVLPVDYGNLILYNTLTGLRPTESIESIKLLKTESTNYLNKETMLIEHYKYPTQFIRRTKKAYISIVTTNLLNVIEESKIHSYTSLQSLLKRKGMEMHMSYCRKIFATYLRNNGIEQEIIDLLQGRISKSVFVRHYYRPDLERFEKIRELLDKLYEHII